MKIIKNKNIIFLLKMIGSITFFWLLIVNIDINEVFKLLINFPILYIFIALSILIIQVLVANFRWKVVLFNLNINVPSRDILKILWIGLFFNQLLPSSVGGDAFRGYYLYKRGFTLSQSVLSVMLDRMIGFLSLVIMVLGTLFFVLDIVSDPIAQWGVLTLTIGASITLLLVLSLDHFSKRLIHWKLFRGLSTVAFEGRKLVLKFSPGFKLLIIGFSIHLLTIFVYLLLLKGMNLDVNLIKFALIIPILGLLMLAPISIAGWGLREGVMVIGLGYLGVLPENAFVLSILYGILLLVVSLPGLLIWLLTGKPKYIK
jgi:glycosyltransferase 2 family protein